MRPYAHIKRTAYFNPRSPRGGATPRTKAALMALAISIHAPHEGERLSCRCCNTHRQAFQSTLPTRGSDLYGTRYWQAAEISIHAPHEGERPMLDPDWPGWDDVFQSTLPTRGSDLLPVAAVGIDLHFNPRSPRGGATSTSRAQTQCRRISIHAPHEGERLCVCLYATAFNAFQSTLPTRGSDYTRCCCSQGDSDFNPRSPRGGAT